MPHENPHFSIKEDAFRSLYHYGPVTAIKFLEDRVYVGYGPRLRVFKRDSKGAYTEETNHKIFHRNKIHAISVSPNGSSIVLAGARSFCVLPSSNIYEPIERAINEWIIAAEFQDEDTLLLLNSHNEILKIDITRFLLIEKIYCNEKSLLYSGSIRVLGPNKVLVAAGTVMNGVLIWDLYDRKILLNITEHEGSIFGVRIDSTGTLITSCSDDRSVKLFNINGQLLATGWGHGSRIWTLDFAKVEENSVMIFSAGEDCTARLWQYTGDDTLVQLKLYDHFHLGKHIWSGDFYDGMFATGGADGKVRLEKTRDYPQQNYTLDQLPVSTETGDFIRDLFALPQRDAVVLLTSYGRLLVCAKDHTQEIHIEGLSKNFHVHAFPQWSSLVVTESNGDTFALFINESLTVKHEKIEVHGEQKKIISVLGSSEGKSCFLLQHSPLPSAPIEIVQFDGSDQGLKLRNILRVAKPEQRSFVPTSVHVDVENGWIFIGSRHALFAVYSFLSNAPLYTTKLCPGDTVTSISGIHSEKEEVAVFVTVRDGFYLVFKAASHGGSFSAKTVLQNKTSRGFIEGGFVRDLSFYIYGFTSSSFYVWNETTQCEIASTVCGGGHRRWRVHVDSANLQLYFSYASKAVVVMKTLQLSFSNEGVLVHGIHGREIRDVSFAPKPEADGSVLLATASEDAVIRLGRITRDGQLHNQWAMNNHISGLQRVGFMGTRFIVSTAANEELIIWEVERMAHGLVVMNECKRIEPNEDHPDVRVMDFSFHQHESEKYTLAIAYSNSSIKIAEFDASNYLLTFVYHIQYGTICVLNVELLYSSNKLFLLSGASDGHLTLWDVSSEPQQPLIRQQIHQSGVKGLLVIPQQLPGLFLVFTGGDDNALAQSHLNLQSEPALDILAFVEKAASATITSISNGFNNRIVTTSVDQIVRLWQYDLELLTCLAAKYTTVADTGCSDTAMIEGVKIGVFAGAGLSTWTW